MRKECLLKTALFDYTRIEYKFVVEKDYKTIRKLIDTPIFRSIDFNKEYGGKNKDLYKTVGEFFIMISLYNIFNTYKKEDRIGWINIFCVFIKRRHLTRDIIDRILSYISRERIPILLRMIINIFVNNYLLLLKTEINNIVALKYHRGVDNIISSYTVM